MYDFCTDYLSFVRNQTWRNQTSQYNAGLSPSGERHGALSARSALPRRVRARGALDVDAPQDFKLATTFGGNLMGGGGRGAATWSSRRRCCRGCARPRSAWRRRTPFPQPRAGGDRAGLRPRDAPRVRATVDFLTPSCHARTCTARNVARGRPCRGRPRGRVRRTRGRVWRARDGRCDGGVTRLSVRRLAVAAAAAAAALRAAALRRVRGSTRDRAQRARPPRRVDELGRVFRRRVAYRSRGRAHHITAVDAHAAAEEDVDGGGLGLLAVVAYLRWCGGKRSAHCVRRWTCAQRCRARTRPCAQRCRAPRHVSRACALLACLLACALACALAIALACALNEPGVALARAAQFDAAPSAFAAASPARRRRRVPRRPPCPPAARSRGRSATSSSRSSAASGSYSST